MVKVEMPLANWDLIDECLKILGNQGYLVGSLRSEIQEQVYSQEC